MKQFYDTYAQDIELSTVLTEITWSNHLHILSKTKTFAEKRYYLELNIQNRYSARELERLIDSGAYERTFLADQKLSTVLTEFPANTKGVFKDTYVFDFLNLPQVHQEKDLRRALISHLKLFLFELGPDFTLMGEEYVIQVGKKDFRIDLLMFHRGLNAMVALELKSTEFYPEHLGQLQFYLEVLDKDVKKPHENPSIGILICKTKDDEVVKYALNRHASPTMIAEYETKLINKTILEQKIHEFSQRLVFDEDKKDKI
jgi:predicted nuclease of restriction endonuclease-like (RecB) superfamily